MRSAFIAIPAIALLLAACGPEQPDAVQNAAAAPMADAAAPASPPGPGFNFEPQTIDSMLERAVANFDRLDGDGDGRVTLEERQAARGDGPGPGSAGPGGGPRGFGGGGLGRADVDGDGVITRQEVEAQTRERFERLDTDGDGAVTGEEMRGGFGGGRGPRGDAGDPR
jgi:hypothetical protein